MLACTLGGHIVGPGIQEVVGGTSKSLEARTLLGGLVEVPSGRYWTRVLFFLGNVVKHWMVTSSVPVFARPQLDS